MISDIRSFWGPLRLSYQSNEQGQKAVLVVRGEIASISTGHRVGSIRARQRVAGGWVNVLD